MFNCTHDSNRDRSFLHSQSYGSIKSQSMRGWKRDWKREAKGRVVVVVGAGVEVEVGLQSISGVKRH
jgi:hypothetical protein